MGKSVYHFDRWAEFLTVTLAENIARCSIGQSSVQKVRIQLAPDQYWPVGYKAILENGLIANGPNTKPLPSDSTVNQLQYYYRNPTQLPKAHDDLDKVAEAFTAQAQKWDDSFYDDAWSLKLKDCIPALLRQLAFRSVSQMLAQQLKHQGIDMTEEFEVQFFDGENYLSFFYDGLSTDIKQQIGFYLGDERVLKLAAECCFSREENRRWFKSL